MAGGILIKFPLSNNTNNFLFGVSKSSKDALKSKLLLLFYTNLNQRYYMPDFGIGLEQYLFEQNDDLLVKQIEDAFKKKVKLYIPEVTITGFNLLDKEENQDINTIMLSIPFQYSEDAYSYNDTIKISFKKNIN